MFDRLKSFGAGLSEIALGTYIQDKGMSIREMVNVDGVPQWDVYNRLVENMGKFQVDALISWGNDIGGALILMSIAEFINTALPVKKELRAEIVDMVNVSMVGIPGAIACLGEIVDIIVLETSNKCLPLGCGDFVDLAIFAGMAAYPFIRKRMRESRSIIEVE